MSDNSIKDNLITWEDIPGTQQVKIVKGHIILYFPDGTGFWTGASDDLHDILVSDARNKQSEEV